MQKQMFVLSQIEWVKEWENVEDCLVTPIAVADSIHLLQNKVEAINPAAECYLPDVPLPRGFISETIFKISEVPDLSEFTDTVFPPEGFQWITDRVPTNGRTVHLNIENKTVVAGFWDKSTKSWLSIFSGTVITSAVFGWTELQLSLTKKEDYHSIDWSVIAKKQKD